MKLVKEYQYPGGLRACTMYLQHFMLIFQTESGFSKKRCSDVQDWGQVCSFQGKNCGGFGAFTITLLDFFWLPTMAELFLSEVVS